MLEPIVKTIEVTCSQQMAFDMFVNINSWWPLDKRSMSMKNGGTAKSVSVDNKVGGQIVEHSNDGNENLWGTIKELEPYHLFSMNCFMGLPRLLTTQQKSCSPNPIGKPSETWRK